MSKQARAEIMTKRLAYSVPEVAQAMGTSTDSWWRAIRRGEVKIVRFGRRVLIPAGELERILGNRK